MTDPALFYLDPVTNHYARALPANTVDGKAYGFPFDDVAGFASYAEDNAVEDNAVEDNAPASITVTRRRSERSRRSRSDRGCYRRSCPGWQRPNVASHRAAVLTGLSRGHPCGCRMTLV
ncbi:beta-1,3-glucanase family protein [Amycolatopsis sp.]|uniref:beta-1,3-glucanase family protein n=1 Tax=Amycolatopsis sp. TaxID=37632 RepID=UPI0039C8B40E